MSPGLLKRYHVVALTVVMLAGCAAMPDASDPSSDVPEVRRVAGDALDVADYSRALKTWRNAEQVNAWIGARFEYDSVRALQLSETQRQLNGRMPIIEPDVFFAKPSGVCTDLSRFAMETLQQIDPSIRARYVMIEFDPVSISGNTLRRHWVVTFERSGQHYFFADSKRPGHIAGPYSSAELFIAEYARYRGRVIVSFRITDTYRRKERTQAAPQSRK